jgi:hypothetical protein
VYATAKKLTWTGDHALGGSATTTVTMAGGKTLRHVVTAGNSNCEAGSADPDCGKIIPQPQPDIRKVSDTTAGRPRAVCCALTSVLPVLLPE